jgi:hypothetical protein
MSHMHYFYVLLKIPSLHLELGVGCLYSPSCREGVFLDTREAPVVLAQFPLDRTPLYRTGYERYSPSFRELRFSETKAAHSSLPFCNACHFLVVGCRRGRRE